MNESIEAHINRLTITEVQLSTKVAGAHVVIANWPYSPQTLVSTSSLKDAQEVYRFATVACRRGHPLLTFGELKPGDQFTFNIDMAPRSIYAVVLVGDERRALSMSHTVGVAVYNAPVTRIEDAP